MVSRAEPEYREMHLALIGNVVLPSLLQGPYRQAGLYRAWSQHNHVTLALQARSVMEHSGGSS